MKMEWLARLLGSNWRAPGLNEPGRSRGIGRYCGGRDLEACRRTFGEAALERICATCPD